jgi:hypothetical protein
VLGISEITIEQLYNRFDESEHIVIDALRESAFCSKMIEGYPAQLCQLKDGQLMIGTHTPDVNMTEFYECFESISKLNAALYQGFQELEKETSPENGFAVACLEVCMMKYARDVLRK